MITAFAWNAIIHPNNTHKGIQQNRFKISLLCFMRTLFQTRPHGTAAISRVFDKPNRFIRKNLLFSPFYMRFLSGDPKITQASPATVEIYNPKTDNGNDGA